ncbi:MAG: DUF1015 domain-containing protein [Syntrophomonadaceae bacterium]|jgi:uncharacterized protein (DUF1015 family)
MAIIRPFKAIRPIVDLAAKVAALPYDVMNSDEAREMVKDNPYSFLHVDKAEIDLEPGIDLYDQQVYEKARTNLEQMIKNGILQQDLQASLYIYRQIMDGHSQTGIVACASIDDYLNNTIKKHELTRKDKEQDRTRHVDCCNAQTGPIFLTYRAQPMITELVDSCTKKAPLYNIVSNDGVAHVIWIIDDNQIIQRLVYQFQMVDCLYIADGHHRCASAVNVGLMRRQHNPDYTGDEEFNYFLAVIFPDEDLNIMDYNRVVQDLNGLTSSEFMEKLTGKFAVSKYQGLGPYKPEQQHYFGMYLDNQWYCLQALPGSFKEDDPVASLDVSILQENVLGPLLGINDPRTDKRIDFVGGIRGLEELERRVQNDMKVAFSMYPTSIQQLMDIADAGQIMPPKSTWFEPKLRSGFFIHRI